MNLDSLFPFDLLLQVKGLTPGRVAALVPVLLGLTSIIVGWVALARARGARRLNTIVALAAAALSIILGIAHLVRTTGEFGAGSGKLGAIVALVLGAIGIILGGKALTRSQRMEKG